MRLIRFIKRAREIGFSLQEVEELLRLRDDHTASYEEVRAAAGAKIEDVERKVESLRAIKRALAVLLRSGTKDGSTRPG